MRRTSRLKAAGYLNSTCSVALLGVVSWKSASTNPLLFAMLIAGMALSIVGMGLRWLSHRADQKNEDKQRSRDGGMRTRSRN